MPGPEGSPVTDYDYIIIGGGTRRLRAGRPAERETRSARVLLLEAGSAEPLPARPDPAAWPSCSARTRTGAASTTAQAGAGALPYPRGRGLGGCGAVNAMAHIRGHRAVYDAWEAGGAAGWGYDGLLPYFKRSEDAARPRPGAARDRRPGPGGPGPA